MANETAVRLGHRRQNGVTLIELMVVVVIVAIIAFIAVPSYSQFVSDSRRSEGRSALTQLSILQEQFFSENNTYTADLMNLGFDAAGWNNTLQGFYRFQVVAATATCPIASCYQLQTRPLSGSIHWGDDFWYELHSSGQQRSRVCPNDTCTGAWMSGWPH